MIRSCLSRTGTWWFSLCAHAGAALQLPRTSSRSRLAAFLLMLLALFGCTGTQEESIPIILVVGSVEAGVPQLQLFEDVRDPMATPARDLVPVAGSAQTLSAAPVSFDVVDRNGDRSELVVLTEDGMLHFFDLTDLPNSFAASRTDVDATSIIPAEQAAGPNFCWQQIQVGGEGSDRGRYAALLDSCSADTTEVYVIDLDSDEFVYAITRQHVLSRLLPAGIHVEQGTDRLYFPVDDITDTEMQWLPVAGASSPEVLGATPIDPLEAVDLAPVANGIGLLDDDGELGIVPFEGDPVSPVELEISFATTLLPDPSGNVELLAAFSESRGSIVEGLDDLDPESLFLQEPLADATLEPVQRFAYLLEEGGIEILDLFPYADPPANRLLFFDLPGLDDPRVITWAFGTRVP